MRRLTRLFVAIALAFGLYAGALAAPAAADVTVDTSANHYPGWPSADCTVLLLHEKPTSGQIRSILRDYYGTCNKVQPCIVYMDLSQTVVTGEVCGAIVQTYGNPLGSSAITRNTFAVVGGIESIATHVYGKFSDVLWTSPVWMDTPQHYIVFS